LTSIKTIEKAADFAAQDSEGREVRLSGFFGQKHVVLVFNRGFF
jgi:hypothetical protein